MEHIRTIIKLVRANIKEFYSPLVIFSYIGIALVIAAVLGIAFSVGVKASYLMDDAIYTGKLEFYAGFVASIMVLLWCVGGTLSLFGYGLAKHSANPTKRTFLLWGGLISYMMLFDDLFLIHETIGDNTVIPEIAIFSCYGLAILYYLVRYYKTILETNFMFLFVGLSCLGCSVLVDVHIFTPDGWSHTSIETGIEESFKLMGVTHWALYHYKVSYQFIRTNFLEM